MLFYRQNNKDNSSNASAHNYLWAFGQFIQVNVSMHRLRVSTLSTLIFMNNYCRKISENTLPALSYIRLFYMIITIVLYAIVNIIKQNI